MSATKSEMVEQVKLRMRLLGINQSSIDEYIKTGDCPFYMDGEEGIVDKSDLMKPVRDKVDAFEKEHGAKVYAVIFDDATFGTCYNLLFVSKYKEDWLVEFRKVDAYVWNVYAYVWNRTCEWCSESGVIAVYSRHGILDRVG